MATWCLNREIGAARRSRHRAHEAALEVGRGGLLSCGIATCRRQQVPLVIIYAILNKSMTSTLSEGRSSLRSRQAELTRDLIMGALARLIVERGLHDFSVQQVADRAGLSHRTVCRHYPSRRDLLDALPEWLRKRLLSGMEAPEDLIHADLPARVVDKFRTLGAFAEHAKAYVLLAMHDRSSRQLRDALAKDLRQRIESGPARHLEPTDAQAASALIGSLFSSTLWYELTEKYGLDSATAGRVASWAISTLEAELERRGASPLDAKQE